MTAALDTHLLVGAFVDELGRCGVRDACTSPGSRCAPLVLAFARDGALNAHSHVDERCAGFFALGLAKASGRPVAVTCTSGTAAANLLPAVIEADEARLPLIVLTADRPPELRDVGAGQAIDQLKLYGDAVRWFFEVGTHAASERALRWVRALACRAVAEATGERPGPVHLNWPLREPLAPGGPIEIPAGRAGRQPWVARERPPQETAALGDLVPDGARAVIVAGRSERPLVAVAEVARACGYPLLADPLSGARRGPAAVAHYDLLLRDPGIGGTLRPEAVIRVGDLPTSKPLRAWLAELADVPQVAIDPAGAWQDPDGVLWRSVRADPARLVPGAAAPPGWLEAWREADARIAQRVAAVIKNAGLSELGVARALGELLPAQATMLVAASMPVRLIESVWPARDDPPRVLANRGANGIDGTVSTAFGVRAGSAAGPVAALLGDLALAHDAGGLLAASRLGLAVTFVLIDNGGGGIFDHLPVAAESDVYEAHIATPTGIDFERLAGAYSLDYARPAAPERLGELLAGALAAERSTLLHVAVERAAGVELQRRLVAAALS
ncbi:MAG TPA: 2-succinyl-5-enolpyruvyl-6-hydroxy-3-cyclohexene-1-carboxylic-acid synthase [Solirubrobacteraceae bacterium]|nr:2-succinyl-5-enolpyruvyl-6-hydroxy-3-cyclohexene-1-carboxylic-acid synthase [Solirubrobacteraceae bacterium]